MKVFILGLFALIMGLMLVGCGGGSGVAAAKGASVRFTVKWPAPTVSRVIPKKTQSIKVTLTSNGITQTQTLARPAGQDSSTATFTNVSVGSASLTATAFPNADGTGNPLATATTNFNVDADTPFDITVTLDSTITHLQVTSNPAIVGGVLTIAYPNTGTISAVGLDANNNIVLTDPAELTITSQSPAVATIVNGLITTLLPATTNIFIHESSSGLSQNITLVVGNYVEGNYTIVNVPVGRIVLTATYTFAASGRAQDWYMDVPKYPVLDGQILNNETITSTPGTGTALVTPPTLDNNTDTVLGRGVVGFAERINPAGTPNFTLVRSVTVFPIARTITQQFVPITIPDLTPSEKSQYGAQSSVVDFHSAAFQSWLTTNNLFRLNGETEVALAKRIANVMHSNLTVLQTNLPQTATSVINAGAGNCHGLSAVMVGALRANGIFARINSGALVQATGGPFDPTLTANFGIGRMYSTAQMFHRMAGWIRVDGQNATTTGAAAVGADDGNMLTLAIGEDYKWVHFTTDITGAPNAQTNFQNSVSLFLQPNVNVWTAGFQGIVPTTTQSWATTRD